MTRPRRSRAEEYARLDDLLSAGVAPPRLVRPEQPWVLRTVLTAFLASAIVYVLLLTGGLSPPYPLILAGCSGVVLVRQAARMVGEPDWRRVGDLVRPPRGPRQHDPDAAATGDDGMAAAVRRWSRLLEWADTRVVVDPGRFSRTVGARIGELVDERLRQRYGITRASDPDRARAIVGESLWDLLGSHRRWVSYREIVSATAELERMWIDERIDGKA
ncbi:MAG: hypothetical protein IRY85_06055 [Micromonosporaceae bacterium]|nr:hypothetical protein [Micromonosporaceae bacterium]